MNHNIISTTIFCSIAVGCIAQTTLPTEQVEVIKNFDARLTDAEKISTPAANLAIDTFTIKQIYNLQIRPGTVAYDPPRLKPLALKREKMPDQYKGVVKAGYGTPNSPFVYAGYHLMYEDKVDLRFGVRHHSANNDKKLANQRFAATQVGMDGHYHIPDRFSIHGDIGFNQDLVYFYGYDHQDTSFTKEAAKQRFNRTHAGLAVYNTQTGESGFDYRISAQYYGLRDFYDAAEDGLDLELSLVKWISGSHPIRLAIGNDFVGFKDTITHNLNNFYIKPSFTYHAESFRIRAGATAVTHDEKFRLLPDLEALVSLAGNAFSIYAGWQGGYHQYSMDNLARYNPFIVSVFTPRTSIFTDIFGGVKGAAKGWNYQAQIGYKLINDLALFLPDSLDSRRFQIHYDTAKNVYFSGGAGIELFDGFDLSATVLQNAYKLNQAAKAWHLPGVEMNGTVKYKMLEDKLLLRGDVFMADGVHTTDSEGNPKRLGSLLDISAGAQYQLIKNLGLWIQLNNLTNNKRERWERYPTFGFNMMGGLQLRF